ncbi:uncharacterized protein TNCV_4975641 [Trichonephila clavipes]|uniref:Uncharacterized protein n=1 Tax=Trichonephila clavipes TaxID=2585209 RepID=A0A8X6VGP8_TRICX|nr:uncharacterized protein TNCV_4975641 [Trichonephila clavipes]
MSTDVSAILESLPKPRDDTLGNSFVWKFLLDLYTTHSFKNSSTAEVARRNTKAKHEKWEKYYNRRRRDVQIKVNDWVLIATHPLSSATRKGVAKFKPKFEVPYRVLEVKNNSIVIWRSGKRLMVNVDQVRIHRHRKWDEMEIRTGSSDSNSSRHKSSSFESVQWRSNESQ